MKRGKYLFLLFFSLLSYAKQAINDSITLKVYYFRIFEEISKPAWRTTKLALQEAQEKAADIVILHLNTYGGELVYADSIRSAILNYPKQVWVFIDKNAASAGALISIACHKIYMQKGATIGAATVVNQNAEPLPDKYQSYMRAMMRSTAEARGRNPDIAQAMVDPDVYIPGIIDSGKVLTFTVHEAIKHGFCEGEVSNIYEILEKNGIEKYEIIKQRVTVLDKIINFFLHPVVSGILIMLMVLGIYYELQTPGIGFAFVVALIAAILFFVPYYLEGLIAYWEIAIFVAGIILLLVELLLIPGFGVAGITGIILMIIGLTFAMINNIGFSLPVDGIDSLIRSLLTVLISLTLAFILSLFITPKIMDVKIQDETIGLKTTLDVDGGYTALNKNLISLKGKTGYAYTVLRPAGKVKIEEEIYDAVALLDYIEKNEEVEVVDVQNMQLVVRKRL
ncbi:MAG: nodulation protein NfeD [Bacteroidales bacterium]|nr:nodulation protein NfeD [Bacteroidales bacterium]